MGVLIRDMDKTGGDMYCLPAGHENPRFYSCERFITADNPGYGLNRCREIVSADGMLMAGKKLMTRERAMNAEIIPGEQIMGVYCLLDEKGDIEDFDIEAAGLLMKGFTFCGFDLADDWQISALVNCGDYEAGDYFDRAFSVDELNEYGLISDHGRVREIKRRLTEEYPDECHAYCAVFAVWRRV